RLSTSAKNFITPLIEIPEIGYDFETQNEAKTIDKHLARFGRRLEANWRFGKSFLDLKLVESHHRMEDGRHPLTYIFDEIGDRNCSAVPVTGIARNDAYQRAVSEIVQRNGNQLCVRVALEEAADANVGAGITELLSFHRTTPEKCDCVLDLGAPNFEPIDGFSALVQGVIEHMPHLSEWQTFTLVGTAFPPSMGDLSEGAATCPRHEWASYKTVAKNLAFRDLRVPTFGDYAVNHPNVLMGDMRRITPATNIRYTIDDAWLIIKGKSRKYGYQQYKGLCETLIRREEYMGASFSTADAYIAKCARGQEKTGNPTRWRRNATNHHIEKVLRDVANFCDSSGLG
ncbi:MAG TPA: beta family protein, partial [Verrucomicrobiae bacterium]|nr:beta family protein [Verrucomicrobiae bacterium]